MLKYSWWKRKRNEKINLCRYVDILSRISPAHLSGKEGDNFSPVPTACPSINPNIWLAIQTGGIGITQQSISCQGWPRTGFSIPSMAVYIDQQPDILYVQFCCCLVAKRPHQLLRSPSTKVDTT